MNRIARWMFLLYPARWRARYGDELDALLIDSGADVRSVVDLFVGGVRMQFSTWSFPRLAVILGTFGVIVGICVSLLTPPNYVAQTEIRLSGADSGALTAETLRARITSRVSLSSVINDPRLVLYSDRLRTTPLEDVIEQMRRDIAIDTVGQEHGGLNGTSTIAIRFTYPDQVKARGAVRDLAANFADALHRMTPERYSSGDTRYLEVVDTPSLPSHAIPLNPWITGTWGLAAGLLVALIWRTVRKLRAPGRRASERTVVRLALAGTLTGIAMVWIVAQFPNLEIPGLRYQSTAKMYAHADGATIAGLLAKLSSRTSLGSIINDPRLRLYSKQLRQKPLEEVTEAMRQDLIVTSRSDGKSTQWIDISFSYTDRFKSQQVVQLMMSRLDEEFQASRGTMGSSVPVLVNWGIIEAGVHPITAESVSQYSRSPLLTGLLWGLSLAAVIALFRRRWTTDDVEAHQPPERMKFTLNGARFRKLAIWLTATGIAAGTIVTFRTPARYRSEALVAFENMNPFQARALINSAAAPVLRDSSRYLTWEQVDTEGEKTDTIRFQCAAGSAQAARAALQEALDDIDRRLTELHGRADSPFETIRGVDGTLLPVTGADISASIDSSAAHNLTMRGISPEASPAIPFDDDRAKPASELQYRSVRMNVIDTPSVPYEAEGMGWSTIPIGGGVGFALAVLLSLLGGFITWFGERRPSAIAGA